MNDSNSWFNDLIPQPLDKTWRKIDFHVHSPCSSDFYGTDNTEDAYFHLLHQAKENGINIICITDHNDIRGYFQLRSIEDDVRKIKDGLEKRGLPVPEKITSQVELFNQIIYMPGVELDLDPNIHLIVLFDPNNSDDTIDEFLSSAGYLPNIRGDETSARHAKWTFTRALEEVAKIGAIAIAAHVDSSKGIYEESKSWGQARIAAFTHPNLSAMEFLKTPSRDQILSLIRNDPNYQRKEPLAFVQSSDFHGQQDQKLGARYTFIRIDNLMLDEKKKTFESIKFALRNPDEFISAPESPAIGTILRKIENQPYVEHINSDENRLKVWRYICAYSNTEDGTIVIGRNQKGNWVGIEIGDLDEFQKKVLDFVETGIEPKTTWALGIYQYSRTHHICTIRTQKQSQICTVRGEDRVYILKDAKPVQISTQEVVQLAEVNFSQRYTGFSISRRIIDLSARLNGLRDTIDILPIVKKIEAVAIPFGEVFRTLKSGNTITDVLKDQITITANGEPDGNFILVPNVQPRFETHYLRFTAPLGSINRDDLQFDDLYKFNNPKIIVSAGGGVFYDEHDDIPVFGHQWEPLVFCQLYFDM